MGAIFNYERFYGLKKPKGPTPEPMSADILKQKVLEMINDAAYEYGHGGYSGSFAEATGCKVIPKQFSDWETARLYLQDKAEKWGPALAVRVITGDASTTGWAVGAWCSS